MDQLIDHAKALIDTAKTFVTKRTVVNMARKTLLHRLLKQT